MMQAQTDLYKGIISGISKLEYTEYCKNHIDITEVNSNFITEIGGITYTIRSSFNNDDQLTVLTFTTLDGCSKDNYNLYTKGAVMDLKMLFGEEYGNPLLDKWVDWSEITQGTGTVFNMYQERPIMSIIYVSKTDNQFRVNCYIGDWNFIVTSNPNYN